MTRKKYKLTACLLIVFFMAIIAVFTVSLLNVKASNEIIFPNEFTVKEEYVYGEVFEMPNPEDVSIKSGSFNSVATSSKITFPDGNEKVGGVYVLNQTGTYEVSYSNANGVSVSKNFIVNKNYYGISGDATAEFTECLPFTNNANGILVSLPNGVSFSFNKYINLKDYKDGVLDVCTVYPYLKETDSDTPVATTVSVKVVDCYNPEKFVEFYVWASGDVGAPFYAGAGSSEQTLTGFEQNRNKPQDMTLPYEGEMYKLWTPRRYQSVLTYGRWLNSSNSSELGAAGGITLKWDLVSNKMSALNKENYLITDIDSPEVYGTNLFDLDSFFTTGEVYLNVECYNYATTTVSVGFDAIFGMKGDNLKDGKVYDTIAPKISVDIEETNENGIVLETGREFVLPKISSVLDFNFYNKINVFAYKNYGTQSQSSIKIVNGKFTPKDEGYYSIVYSATDSYGNVGKYIINCTAVNSKAIVYEENALTKLVGASENVFPAINASGLNKTVKTQLFITSPIGKTVELESINDGYNFVPDMLGDYNVKYLFSDNVYSQTFEYSVKCFDESSVYFKDTFAFSPYFIKGASYYLKQPIAYTSGNNGFIENNAELYVSVDGGEFTRISSEQMSEYQVNATEKLQFKASYGGFDTLSREYKVVDVGFGLVASQKNYDKYMQGNYSTSELTSLGALYKFDGTFSNARLEFINLLSSANFKISFSLSGTANKIVFRLNDAENSDEFVEYSFEKTGASSVTLYLRKIVNGTSVFNESLFTGRSSLLGQYDFAYSGTVFTMGDKVVNTKNLLTSGDLSSFVIEIDGVSSGTEILLSQVNNQALKTATKESKPQFMFVEADGSYDLGQEYVISKCICSAVMEPVLIKNATLTVTKPDGTIATTVDGISLSGVPANKEYKLLLNSIGQFKILYTTSFIGASRTNGKDVISSEEYYIINVNDTLAPQLRFSDGSNEKTVVNLEVGVVHTLKEFTFSDNFTTNENLRINKLILTEGYLLAANGFDVDSYAFRDEGTYYVYIVAYDEFGNSSNIHYTVKVS